MGRRVMGVIVGLGMMAMGLFNVWRGMHEMSGPAMGDLLDRPLSAAVTLRPWEACTAEETAYAATRPAWTAPAGIDVAAPWSIHHRTEIGTRVYASGADATPRLRDCTEAGGPIFRRLVAFDDVDAIAADEGSSAHARALAVAEYMGAVAPGIAGYCGEGALDDYQWECARVTITTQRIATTMLALAARTEQEDPSVRDVTSWSHGLATVRGAVPTTTSDALRLLELPAGVRPGVRALLAHMLAEDAAAARAVAGDPAAFVPLRARVVALSQHEAQPEVREALALALTRWPG